MKENMKNDEHILVCLSTAPSNARIIKTAAKMAGAFNSQLTALFVETPDFAVASEENRNRLRDNCRLARELGAGVETVYGEDVAYQIAEFVRVAGITRIVLGRSAVTRRHLFGKPTLTEQLLAYAPEVDIHIIPDKTAEVPYHPRRAHDFTMARLWHNLMKSFLILLGATLLSLLFHRLGFTDANIIMVYILGVVLTSVVTSHQLYSLASSIASVFIFNYLFTVPRFSLAAYETGYPVTFIVMFLTAYMTGTLARGYQEKAGQSAKIARRTKILFDTDQMLSRAGSREEILNTAAEQIKKLLNRNIVIFEAADGQLSAPRFYQTDSAAEFVYDADREISVARWAMQHNHSAGAATENMPDASYLYLALRAHDKVYGVVGIEAVHDAPEASEHDILLPMLGECALALENEQNAREKEAAAVLAENEQLRANLLRTISHDLRTPLTAISGHASNLMYNGSNFDDATKQQLYSEIYEDAMWLINLVENLLYATRIEEGRMTLRTSTELLSEIVEEAMHQMERIPHKQRIMMNCGDELLLVKADAKLVIQVIVNIVDNAVKYTPDDSHILVTAGKKDNWAVVQIADNGYGIPDREKEKIFDKFYCGANKIADNRRSLGLGLYLCKAIVEAHGGKIDVTDNEPQGTVFSFTLPLEEAVCYE